MVQVSPPTFHNRRSTGLLPVVRTRCRGPVSHIRPQQVRPLALNTRFTFLQGRQDDTHVDHCNFQSPPMGGIYSVITETPAMSSPAQQLVAGHKEYCLHVTVIYFSPR